jgi:hypothetical protein
MFLNYPDYFLLELLEEQDEEKLEQIEEDTSSF